MFPLCFALPFVRCWVFFRCWAFAIFGAKALRKVKQSVIMQRVKDVGASHFANGAETSEVGGKSAAAQPGNRFVSFVRARGAGCKVEMPLKTDAPGFPFSLEDHPPSPQAPIQL